MSRPRVLSVGQCGFDHASISRRLASVCGAETVAAGSRREALELVRGRDFDLVLVNRIFDRDGDSGLELIRAVKSDPALASVNLMLVSDYESAQVQATALGALPGFGKSDLHRPEAAERIRNAVAPAEVKPT